MSVSDERISLWPEYPALQWTAGEHWAADARARYLIFVSEGRVHSTCDKCGSEAVVTDADKTIPDGWYDGVDDEVHPGFDLGEYEQHFVESTFCSAACGVSYAYDLEREDYLWWEDA